MFDSATNVDRDAVTRLSQRLLQPETWFNSRSSVVAGGMLLFQISGQS